MHVSRAWYVLASARIPSVIRAAGPHPASDALQVTRTAFFSGSYHDLNKPVSLRADRATCDTRLILCSATRDAPSDRDLEAPQGKPCIRCVSCRPSAVIVKICTRRRWFASSHNVLVRAGDRPRAERSLRADL